MADNNLTNVQQARGNNNQVTSRTLSNGQIVVNTDTKRPHVGDGVKVGGHVIALSSDLQSNEFTFCSVSGTSDDIILSTTPEPEDRTHLQGSFQAAESNTGTVTLTWGDTTKTSLKKLDATGAYVELEAGDIKKNHIVSFVYNAAQDTYVDLSLSSTGSSKPEIVTWFGAHLYGDNQNSSPSHPIESSIENFQIGHSDSSDQNYIDANTGGYQYSYDGITGVKTTNDTTNTSPSLYSDIFENHLTGLTDYAKTHLNIQYAPRYTQNTNNGQVFKRFTLDIYIDWVEKTINASTLVDGDSANFFYGIPKTDLNATGKTSLLISRLDGTGSTFSVYTIEVDVDNHSVTKLPVIIYTTTSAESTVTSHSIVVDFITTVTNK